MMKTIRKNKSFEQKKKRLNAHHVGKQYQASDNKKSSGSMNIFLRRKMLFETNKEYRNAEFQQSVGALLATVGTIYLLVGFLYYFSVKVLNSYALKFVLKMISLGFLKTSVADSFQEPTVWEIVNNYSMGQPVAVAIGLVILLVAGFSLVHKGQTTQSLIDSNTDDEKLKKDYEKLKEERYSDYDCYNQKLD
ncbi:TPA: hypothetical protein U1B12_000494 [Streptococcus suis]|uniref:hypothetical protein n=1 Tax=Streptococcus suis TaxID=1307 RepID=UPI00209A8014|nr:hypothetical protein [Streptococcus suis]MCO8200430.1 hypothetical protein [Streptococcus suis]MCO8217967.1 hypothetical protein [Streptococcus suis]HEM3467373.1 hypothetical protein [Streptococcus suis]HEM3478084.1 hypothetical protein [Streptococcus suis]